MQPLLVFPDPCPAELAQALDTSGFPWQAVASPADVDADEPEDGWAGAVDLGRRQRRGRLRARLATCASGSSRSSR